MAHFNAASVSGIDRILTLAGFDSLAEGADLIITGEGAADRQTLMGKLPMGILQQAGGIPTYLIAGRVDDRERILQAGFAGVECINPDGISLDEALRKDVAQQNIRATVRRICSSLQLSRITN